MEVITKLEANNNQERGKIKVGIDADLEDIIPGYLTNRYQDVTLIQSALAIADYEAIRISGHSMKGSGGGYGFDVITEYGQALETAAKNRDKVMIRITVEELKTYLDCVEVIYE
jgi:HPt (histidine-containing phosphotransfer) domain-containing protein